MNKKLIIMALVLVSTLIMFGCTTQTKNTENEITTNKILNLCVGIETQTLNNCLDNCTTRDNICIEAYAKVSDKNGIISYDENALNTCNNSSVQCKNKCANLVDQNFISYPMTYAISEKCKKFMDTNYN